jgi:PH (Pleckstrin Homology) domain-containing protein
MVTERYDLAPMTTGLRIMTWLCFTFPAAIAYAAIRTPIVDAGPMRTVRFLLYGVTVFMVLIYASVYLFWRPVFFEIDRGGLNIVWPVRLRRIGEEEIQGVRIIEAQQFRQEYGYGMRIGAGGLWGGFGLLKCGKMTFSMWISRTDAFVIVELRDARPLLITPEDPEGFASSLRRFVS